MINYDKHSIKEQLNTVDIYELVQGWGGEPEWTNFGFISSTICHNPAGVGSRKLYYYNNSTLFRCFTGCDEPSFDIFELCRKVMKIQYNKEFDLNDAIRYIAYHFGLTGQFEEENGERLEDWSIFDNINRIKEISIETKTIELKEYNPYVLNNFNHNVKIGPWLKDGISEEVMRLAGICYYPGPEQIIIPHYDINNRLIGIRGRSLVLEDAETYGKYRPIKVGLKDIYNHPLGLNLYGLNWNKENIKRVGKAIIAESEKSVLQYASYFGWTNNICVACCGSNITNYQINLLLSLGVKEIIIAFDRQFQKIGDKEYNHLIKNYTNIYNKYHSKAMISFIFDKKMITPYKASPTDCGKDIFIRLYKERTFITERGRFY